MAKQTGLPQSLIHPKARIGGNEKYRKDFFPQLVAKFGFQISFPYQQKLCEVAEAKEKAVSVVGQPLRCPVLCILFVLPGSR